MKFKPKNPNDTFLVCAKYPEDYNSRFTNGWIGYTSKQYFLKYVVPYHREGHISWHRDYDINRNFVRKL